MGAGEREGKGGLLTIITLYDDRVSDADASLAFAAQ